MRTAILSLIATIAAAIDIFLGVQLAQHLADPAHVPLPAFAVVLAMAVLTFLVIAIILHLVSRHAAGEDLADSLEELRDLLALGGLPAARQASLEADQRAARRQLRRLRGAARTTVARHARNLPGPGGTL